jgi:hypothetical protein
MPKTPDPRQFHAPAATFGTTTPPASTGRMTPARRRALLGHTAAGRAILAAEDARNGARAVARRQGLPAPGMIGG